MESLEEDFQGIPLNLHYLQRDHLYYDTLGIDKEASEPIVYCEHFREGCDKLSNFLELVDAPKPMGRVYQRGIYNKVDSHSQL